MYVDDTLCDVIGCYGYDVNSAAAAAQGGEGHGQVYAGRSASIKLYLLVLAFSPHLYARARLALLSRRRRRRSSSSVLCVWIVLLRMAAMPPPPQLQTVAARGWFYVRRV